MKTFYDDKLFLTPKQLAPAKYSISVSVDIEKNTYTGVETIIWRNISRLDINKLCIDRGIIAEHNLLIAEINGELPNESQLFYHGGFIFIDLPEPVIQDGSIEIKIKFSAELPKSDFHEGDIFEFAGWVAWYPKLYWDEPVGNSYQVTFESIPAGYQVFAAGLKNGSTYTEENVANYYGFAVSKEMTAISSEIHGITATVVHYPKHRECAEFMLERAVDALNFFIDFVGFYPYKSFTIIPGSDKWSGGYRYSSGIVYVHSLEKYNPEDNGYMEYYNAIVPHEIGHQYFWEYVLENECPGWLGLGLSLSLDSEYSLCRMGIKSFHKGLIDDYTAYVNANKNTTITLSEEEAGKALSGEDNEYGGNYYGSVCHGKSFAIMSMLIDILGKDCYFDIMRHILRNYGGRALYAPDFISICEGFSGMNLNWFFNQWLKSNKSLSYSVEVVSEKESGGIYEVTAEICRNGSLLAPVCVAAYFEDGSSQFKFTERLSDRQTLTFTAKSKYAEICLTFNIL